MSLTRRKCDNCGEEYHADNRNLKRGWGLTCSKSCAASKREKKKPGYNKKKVEENNIKRESWNAPSIVGGSGVVTGVTSEGYRIMDGTAYDEFDSPVYDVDPNEDEHPFSTEGLGQD
jgi:hypothetical protein